MERGRLVPSHTYTGGPIKSTLRQAQLESLQASVARVRRPRRAQETRPETHGALRKEVAKDTVCHDSEHKSYCVQSTTEAKSHQPSHPVRGG